MQEISIEGMTALWAQFRAIAEAPEEKALQEKLMKRAFDLRDAIRAKAPKGPKGNLRNGVVAKRFKQKIKGNPAVFVTINYKKAPHYHWIEFGTTNRRYPKNSKLLKFVIGGRTIFVKSVGHIPAQPFFRPTVDARRGQILTGIAQDTWDVINESGKK